MNTQTTIKVKWNLKRTRYAELSDGTKILIPQDIRLAYRRLQRRLEKIPTLKPGNTRDTYLLVTDNLQLNLAMKTFRWINRIFNYLSKQWYTTIIFVDLAHCSTTAVKAAWNSYKFNIKRKAEKMGKDVRFMTSADESQKLSVTERERAVIRYMLDNPTVRLEQIAEYTNASLNTIKRDVKHLEDLGHIRRYGGKRYGRWSVNETNDNHSADDYFRTVRLVRSNFSNQ